MNLFFLQLLVFSSVLATAMGAAPQDGGKGDESKVWGATTDGVPMLSQEHHKVAEVNKSHHRHLFGFKRFGSRTHSTTPIPVAKALQKDTVKVESKSRSHRFVTTVRNLMHRNRHVNETKGNQTQHNRKWKKMLWKH